MDDDMIEALINGDVLRWARQRRGWNTAELSALTKISEENIKQWESGDKHPPFGKAELLSSKLKIPFGFLFLSKRPTDALPISDFRTRRGDRPDSPSPDLLAIINQTKVKQEWYREFSEDEGRAPLSWVGSAHITDNANHLAAKIGSSLGLNDLRRSVDNPASYIARISEAAQQNGVLVMRSGIVGGSRRALSSDEFQGFALSDPYAPVAFVNVRDSANAQVFTLIHEVVHLWLNQSAVSKVDSVTESSNEIENFCNTVTAETLVPSSEFLSSWSLVRPGDIFAEKLSRIFWVSPLVIIRRAYELNKIGRQVFIDLVVAEKAKVFKPKKRKGGDPTRTLLSRNSLRFTSAVLAALKSNRVGYRDAAGLLGIKMTGLDSLIRKNIA